MYFLYLIVLFFGIIGAISVIKGIAISFLRIKDSGLSANLLITISDLENNDIEMETKIALSRLRWYNIKGFDNVYVVGRGLSAEKFKLCKDHFRQSDIEMLSCNEFLEIFNYAGNAHD